MQQQAASETPTSSGLKQEETSRETSRDSPLASKSPVLPPSHSPAPPSKSPALPSIEAKCNSPMRPASEAPYVSPSHPNLAPRSSSAPSSPTRQMSPEACTKRPDSPPSPSPKPDKSDQSDISGSPRPLDPNRFQSKLVHVPNFS